MATVKLRELGSETDQEVWDLIARKLKLPAYFGKNLAALEDCLEDMDTSTRFDVTRAREGVPAARRDLFDGICSVVARVALENDNVHLTVYTK
ncbi:MAG: barstar family protein [Atopobiaceae bacterium]|uniref:Barstar family protein n=1 Tax=Olsenella absiana TaxID=3115222 RepID=A0ABU7R970_9ACTN|nr:barstar family protein [Olsenella sp.]MDD7364346.1 barstar family protein [Olsenella sp.]MDY3900099.1 barstar family protein [Atopobiaceae bacterium]